MRKHTVTLLEKLPSWILTIITVAIILWLTLASKPLGDEPPPMFPGADKMAHAVMFGFLTLMILLDSVRKREWVKADWWILAAAIIGSALLGVGVEFMQKSMGQGRSFEVADMIADSAGALIAGAGWYIWEKTRSKNGESGQ